MAAAEARASFFELLEKVSKLRRIFTITNKGTAKAVIMSAEEFEEWAETMEILASKKTVRGIKKGVKEIKTGKYVRHGEVFGKSR